MRKNTIASRCCRLTSRYCRIAGVAVLCVVEEMEAMSRRPGVSMKAEYNIALMVVLALETATRRGSATLWVDGACDRALGSGSPDGHDARTHGERLPGALLG